MGNPFKVLSKERVGNVWELIKLGGWVLLAGVVIGANSPGLAKILTGMLQPKEAEASAPTENRYANEYGLDKYLEQVKKDSAQDAQILLLNGRLDDIKKSIERMDNRFNDLEGAIRDAVREARRQGRNDRGPG